MGRSVIFKKIKQKSQKIIPYSIITLYHQESQELNVPSDKINLILNKKLIDHKISRLKLTASEAQCGVLCGTHVGEHWNMMAINKNINSQKKWLSENYNNPDGYNYYLNSKILSASNPKLCTQQNVSFPLLHADIKRYSNLQIEFNDIEGKLQRKQINQFQAFAFQQAYDFFIGRHILDWRIHQGSLRLQQDVKQKLIKTCSVLEQYSKEKFPKLFQMPQSLNQNNIWWLENRGAKDQISIESDYLIRIQRHYRKQMILLLQRMENNIL